MNISLTTMWDHKPIICPLEEHVEHVLSGDYPANTLARLLANIIKELNPSDEQIQRIFKYTSTSTVHGLAPDQ